ncbi:hypothetical protein D9756_003614 [Leucocoprinus leucothites]|uniref:HNH nuclease domain-containing protein n=1 Tax=Leucocoprinus leucothites TaxID=201217 RepID=A0A8H5G7Z9_9AGAR|nr:hypothetical protein D9756_003614 [Leucoagaricus leucothites]
MKQDSTFGRNYLRRRRPLWKTPKAAKLNIMTLLLESPLGLLSEGLQSPYSRFWIGSVCTSVSGDHFMLQQVRRQSYLRRLVELGLRYRNYLLRVFRSNTGGRPTPSRHVSRPSFDVVKERILEELGKAPQTEKSVKKQALLRDGRGPRSSITLETEVAHIFSESAQDGDKDYAATVLAMLEMFGLGEKAKSLYGGQVNSLHNVITMEHNLHAAFDSFDLWLEPVAEHENTYKVCGNTRRLKRFPLPIPSRITFSVDPAAAAAAEAVNKELMLPDRSLIAIRAACARVANLSGAAEQAKRILRDLEDTTILADDGSTAELLSSRLLMLTSRFVYVHGSDVPAAQLMT